MNSYFSTTTSLHVPSNSYLCEIIMFLQISVHPCGRRIEWSASFGDSCEPIHHIFVAHQQSNQPTIVELGGELRNLNTKPNCGLLIDSTMYLQKV